MALFLVQATTHGWHALDVIDIDPDDYPGLTESGVLVSYETPVDTFVPLHIEIESEKPVEASVTTENKSDDQPEDGQSNISDEELSSEDHSKGILSPVETIADQLDT